MSGRRRCVVSRSSPSPDAVAILTDGDAVYDVRGISAAELGELNETAQDVTEGELWWELLEIDNTDDISAQNST
jgi:hypothetical protein